MGTGADAEKRVAARMPKPSSAAQNSTKRALSRSFLALVLTIVLYSTTPLPNDVPGPVGLTVFSVVGVWFLIVLFRQIRVFVQTHGQRQVRFEALATSLYLVVITFALIYDVMAKTPGAFAGLSNRVDGLYMTVATLTTVGFGDVHATGENARIVVTLQMGFDLFFVATFAGLVSGIVAQRRAAATGVANGAAPADGKPDDAAAMEPDR
jgi:voltage-gated potassium channel